MNGVYVEGGNFGFQCFLPWSVFQGVFSVEFEGRRVEDLFERFVLVQACVDVLVIRDLR